jgi:hypothetical protein
VCVKGESNPQLNLGRVPCYHYTIDALGGGGMKKKSLTYSVLKTFFISTNSVRLCGFSTRSETRGPSHGLLQQGIFEKVKQFNQLLFRSQYESSVSSSFEIKSICDVVKH